jgi:hypothetical protein
MVYELLMNNQCPQGQFQLEEAQDEPSQSGRLPNKRIHEY